MSITFPLDHSGVAPTNLVTGEIHSVNEAHFKDYFFLVPHAAPFYVTNFKATLTLGGVTTPLTEDVDYSFALPYVTGTRVTGKAMYGAVTLHNLEMSGLITIQYQTVGGDQIPDRLQVLTELAEQAYNPRTTIWDILTNAPAAFPPTPHYQDYDSFYGQEELVNMLGEIRDAIIDGSANTADDINRFLKMFGVGGGLGTADFVLKTGDTMSGPLLLEGIPSEDQHAVSKKYIDVNFVSREAMLDEISRLITASQATSLLNEKLDKVGGFVSGHLELHADPITVNHAANKRYVDALETVVNKKFSDLQLDIGDIGEDRVTKAYVDAKFDELLAYVQTIGSIIL